SNYINSIKYHAFLDNIKELLLELDPTLGKFQNVTEDLSSLQKWGFLAFASLSWIYLTARPGLLVGAIDAYFMAPIQMVLDSLFGRRSLKRSDFVIEDKLGEGSFEQERIKKSGNKARNVITKLDAKSKDKVILKKVSLVMVENSGILELKEQKKLVNVEEWFNYRLSRAVPKTCAKFFGSFVDDKSNSLFTKGGKWLGYDVTGWLFSCRLHDGLKLSFKLGICHVSTSLARDRLVEKRCLDHQAIMRQMITLLKKIHDTGVGHQDIKPANLVVTKQGQIKFINFGSAIDLQIGKNY
ncbi:hypothetical protein S83_031697, partial [Arachis hypogaea]